MKVKTQDLIGPALDWVIGVCFGYKEHLYREVSGKLCFQSRQWAPSTSGDTVIEIMEREGVTTYWADPQSVYGKLGMRWSAECQHLNVRHHGPTLRIAVFRCFVASKLGDEVDVPEELMT